MYSKRFPCTANDGCHLNLQLQRWIWTGREDASKIEEKINEVAKNRKVHLLWTDSIGEGPISTDSNKPHSQPHPETYIILDGTWQQAKQIFRKTPALWKLRRVSLQSNVPPSKYVLRGDYSGWKERFSNDVNSKNLLCTAEVGAAVLDRCGDDCSGDTIRTRLQNFQDSLLQNKS
mmetsp:Transcript_3268/g.7242  ORF Transcript_3268/g.7242 Transcript_3268/m.7242 type:complete len:175 (+) Transcript_3268:52-576(+)